MSQQQIAQIHTATICLAIFQMNSRKHMLPKLSQWQAVAPASYYVIKSALSLLEQGFTDADSLRQGLEALNIEPYERDYLEGVIDLFGNPDCDIITDVVFRQAVEYFNVLIHQQELRDATKRYGQALPSLEESPYPALDFAAALRKLRADITAILSNSGTEVQYLAPSQIARSFEMGSLVFKYPIKGINSLLGGGVRTNTPIVIGAPTNNGKSSWSFFTAAIFLMHAVEHANQYPDAAPQIMDYIQTEVASEIAIRSVIAAATGLSIYEVNAVYVYDVVYEAYDTLNDPIQDQTVRNALELVQRSYEARKNPLGGLPLDEFLNRFIEIHADPENTTNRMFTGEQQRLVWMWDRIIDRHMKLHTTITGWDHMHAIMQEAAESKHSFVLVDHMQGIPSLGNNSPQVIDYGFKRCCELSRTMGFMMLSQLDPASESKLRAGDKKKKVAISFRGTNATLQHTRYAVLLQADRQTNTTSLTPIKSQDQSDIVSIRLGYSFYTKRYYSLAPQPQAVMNDTRLDP